ncbi:MAG: hypothetical protein H6729_11640 [Deltaproteobacteria bacterium]|nr:hypothetical protein [Deltaproteobacteria bacterium]
MTQALDRHSSRIPGLRALGFGPKSGTGSERAASGAASGAASDGPSDGPSDASSSSPIEAVAEELARRHGVKTVELLHGAGASRRAQGKARARAFGSPGNARGRPESWESVAERKANKVKAREKRAKAAAAKANNGNAGSNRNAGGNGNGKGAGQE